MPRLPLFQITGGNVEVLVLLCACLKRPQFPVFFDCVAEGSLVAGGFARPCLHAGHGSLRSASDIVDLFRTMHSEISVQHVMYDWVSLDRMHIIGGFEHVPFARLGGARKGTKPDPVLSTIDSIKRATAGQHQDGASAPKRARRPRTSLRLKRCRDESGQANSSQGSGSESPDGFIDGNLASSSTANPASNLAVEAPVADAPLADDGLDTKSLASAGDVPLEGEQELDELCLPEWSDCSVLRLNVQLDDH